MEIVNVAAASRPNDARRKGPIRGSSFWDAALFALTVFKRAVFFATPSAQKNAD